MIMTRIIISSAYEVDSNAAEELKDFLKAGILRNKQTDLFHRTARQSQRRSAATQKAKDSEEKHDSTMVIRKQLEEELELRRQSSLKTRLLKDELGLLNGNVSTAKSKKKVSMPLLVGNSSGVVKSRFVPSKKIDTPIAVLASTSKTTPSPTATNTEADTADAIGTGTYSSSCACH